MMSFNAREYLSSRQQSWLVYLVSGLHFRGIYTLSARPTVTVARGEECYEFWVWDLTGRIRCTIPAYRTMWTDMPTFRPQRLWIEGYAEGEGSSLVGRVKAMEPVQMIW